MAVADLSISDAPVELADAIREFFPESEWDNAARVSYLESGWSAFALADTTTPSAPCGFPLYERDGVTVTAERSIGWFQINGCNLPPGWRWEMLFNTRHNVGTAHLYWSQRGWQPWYFSARQLGLLPL